MADVGGGRVLSRDMSLMGQVAALLGSEENALRILLSLLLGMSSALLFTELFIYVLTGHRYVWHGLWGQSTLRDTGV